MAETCIPFRSGKCIRDNKEHEFAEDPRGITWYRRTGVYHVYNGPPQWFNESGRLPDGIRITHLNES